MSYRSILIHLQSRCVPTVLSSVELWSNWINAQETPPSPHRSSDSLNEALENLKKVIARCPEKVHSEIDKDTQVHHNWYIGNWISTQRIIVVRNSCTIGWQTTSHSRVLILGGRAIVAVPVFMISQGWRKGCCSSRGTRTRCRLGLRIGFRIISLKSC